MDAADTTMLLAPTIAPLEQPPRPALQRIRELGFRAVQLSATMPEMRPGELDASARRDLAATLRRMELTPSGIDLWIPFDHFQDPALVDRAVRAVGEAIELAGDLGRCPLSLTLPSPSDDESNDDEPDLSEVIAQIASHAERFGVAIADHAPIPPKSDLIGIGVDPAACLARNDDPAQMIAEVGGRLASARLCDLLRTGQRGPIGDAQDGQLDVTAYRVALSVIDYRRPLVVDMRQWRDPEGGLILTKRAWESCVPI